MLSFQTLQGGSVGIGGSTAALLDRSLRRLFDLINSSAVELRLEGGLRAPERVSVSEFIEEIEVGASMEAVARGLTLSVTPGEPGVDMNVDRPLLAAAVANLLQNAFKFTRPHGHVSLKTSSTKDRVLIEVEDECGGLPPCPRPHLASAVEAGGQLASSRPPRSGITPDRRKHRRVLVWLEGIVGSNVPPGRRRSCHSTGANEAPKSALGSCGGLGPSAEHPEGLLFDLPNALA
jgi:histidine kinase/DNA gyrase B/HSP90-like ATPase